MACTLEWLGVSTFRLTIGDLVIFLDAYMDRVAAAPQVGLSAPDVDRADYLLVGHSHFDHLAGAQYIARNTGATVIGSYETARLLALEGVAGHQLTRVAGGEAIALGDNVVLRVYPSQHTCALVTCGVLYQERKRHFEEHIGLAFPPGSDLRDHMEASLGSAGIEDGGCLAYLLETPYGTLFWKDSPGHWSGILRSLRADVALLAAANVEFGMVTVDGEPFQGSGIQFLCHEAGMLHPRKVVMCHHDDWAPPLTTASAVTSYEPWRRALAQSLPGAELLELDYLVPVPIFNG